LGGLELPGVGMDTAVACHATCGSPDDLFVGNGGNI